MSYDLDFWKYKKDVSLNHQEVYEKCSNGEVVEGLEDLPIKIILEDIQKAFSDWGGEVNTDYPYFTDPSGKGAFDIYTTNQFVRFDCYRVKGEDMNRIIDIMLKYDCPLYDPQVPKRFD